MRSDKKSCYKKIISLLIVVTILCFIFAGCGHRLNGEYTSESGYYSVRFSSNGDCTWYQDGSFFEGEYYWDSSDNCYYLEIQGNGFYSNTRFTARENGNGLIINGGTVHNEAFKR